MHLFKRQNITNQNNITIAYVIYLTINYKFLDYIVTTIKEISKVIRAYFKF